LNNIKTIGVQQYMFRDHFKSETEAAQTLKKIRAIGYDSIELCEFLTDPDKSIKGSPLEVKQEYDWTALLKQADLKVCAIHDTLENILKAPEAMVDKAKRFGALYLVAAATLKTDFLSAGSVAKFIKDLNSLGKQLKDNGIALLYHNHNMELERAAEDQVTGMERLVNGIDPKYVKLELDTFWLQNGGANPVVWCEKAKDKIEILHLNDCKVLQSAPGDCVRTAVGAELGSGNMELKAILKAAITSGCSCLVLETHDNWINNDPFESSGISYRYIQEHL